MRAKPIPQPWEFDIEFDEKNGHLQRVVKGDNAPYKAYIEALDRFGIPIEESLVFAGDFVPASGAAVIESLGDDELASIDAIVAANDNMALGALEALRHRGLTAPNDIVVVGFDDTDESNIYFINPVKTTRCPEVCSIKCQPLL